MAAHWGILVAQLLTAGDPELLPDQVQPGDLLRDRVLHLQAGVHLQERDGPVGAHQELTGARAAVPGLTQDGLGGAVQPLLLLGGQERGRCLLHELLVAALQGTVAGGDHHHVAGGIGQALGLHVAGGVQEALHEALAAAERRSGLTDGGLVELGDVLALADHLDAAASTAVGGLDGQGESVLVGEGQDLVRTGDRVSGSRDQGCADLLGQVAGGDLVSELFDGGRGRTDPDEAGVLHGPGEVGVLREEAVPGVDRISLGCAGGLDDLLDHQVGVCGGGSAQGDGLVCQAHVQRVPVRLGVDGHGRQAFIMRSAYDADRDLPAVGHQHPGERAGDGGGLVRRLGHAGGTPSEHVHRPGGAVAGIAQARTPTELIVPTLSRAVGFLQKTTHDPRATHPQL